MHLALLLGALHALAPKDNQPLRQVMDSAERLINDYQPTPEETAPFVSHHVDCCIKGCAGDCYPSRRA